MGSDSDDLLPERRLWRRGDRPQHLLASADPALHLCVPPCHALPEHPLHSTGQRFPTLWHCGFWHFLLLPYRYFSTCFSEPLCLRKAAIMGGIAGLSDLLSMETDTANRLAECRVIL